MEATPQRSAGARTGAATSPAPPPLDGRFRALFEAEFGYVSRVLRRFGVKDADLDDAAQETWVAVHRHLAAYDATRPVRPWLTTFAFNVAANYRRLARHRYETSSASDRESGDTLLPSTNPSEHHEARDVLLRALDELPLVKRDVFVMHDVEHLEPKEIASLLGIPVNTVYSRLRTAREELERIVREISEVPA